MGAYYLNPERELRRIYRKAAMLGEEGFIFKLRRTYRKIAGKRSQDDVVRQSLITVVNDKRFWREEVLEIAVNRAEEKARFSQLFMEQIGEESNEYKDIVTAFYRAVHNGLRKSQQWKEQAKDWRNEIERERLEARVVNATETRRRTVEVNEDEDVIAREGADLAQLTLAQDELLELHERARAHKDAELALQIAYELSVIRDFKGNRAGAREILDNTLDLVLKQDKNAPRDLKIRVLARAAHLANKQGECEEAEKYAGIMLELSRENNQNVNVARALQYLGRSKYFRCDSEWARELLEESLIQFQSLEPPDLTGVAWVQFDLGMLEVNQGDLTAARSWLEKSLDLHQRSANNIDENGEGTIRVNLAFVVHKQGDWKAAHALMTKARELLEGKNYHRWYLHFLGRLNIDEDNFELAHNRFKQSLNLFQKRQDKLGIIRSLLGFSYLAAKQGDWGKAVTLISAENTQRNKTVNVPFPLDWEDEKKFIETGAHEVLGKAAFDVAWIRGEAMNSDQAIKICLT